MDQVDFWRRCIFHFIRFCEIGLQHNHFVHAKLLTLKYNHEMEPLTVHRPCLQVCTLWILFKPRPHWRQ